MAALPKTEVQQLVTLARDKSAVGRSALVAAIHDLYSGNQRVLTSQDRVVMLDIIRRLIHEVEISVRRTLAEHFAERPDAPHDLVVTLANDEIEVAHPVLVTSEVLKDPELIEIVRHRTMEHQVAIAMRPRVSEPVSDALVETDRENVITTLLSNRGARISIGTMDYLVEQSQRVSSYQKPLVERHDLSPQLAKKLYWGVSAALRTHILENFDIDPDALDETMESAVHDVIVKETEAIRRTDAQDEPVEPEDTGDEHILVQLLRQGEVARFLDRFTRLTNLRLNLARRILFEPNGEGLAIACKAIGLDKHTFVSIFLRFRQGRLGDKRVEQDELSRALNFYGRTAPETAKALVRRWRRDPDYLNALRLVEQAHP